MSERERRGRPRGDAPQLSLGELEEIRHLLAGGSVIEWFRLNHGDRASVDRFLKLNEIDLEEPSDRERLEHLKRGAVSYLQETFETSFAEVVLDAPPVALFEMASDVSAIALRKDACAVLKTMHVLHHIEARKLRYRLPLAEARLAKQLVDKVDRFVGALADEGFPLVRYEGGEKSNQSLVTKLLVKRETHAATIYDRVRFRFVVERDADLLPLLHRMTRELLPFNYVVPGRSVNLLINFAALIESHAAYREHAKNLQIELGQEESQPPKVNEFSGETFRIINFIADVPIRISDELLQTAEGAEQLGRIIFVLAEFQVTDEATAEQNALGENNHVAYRDRQLKRVWDRLQLTGL